MYCNDTWEQEWGGNLVINNKDTILPIKNTVVVFDYTKNNINHEVTKVESDKNRFCITTFVNKL
jgi:Rps23 Pro-64 3,4-dihydroxylase Tpa1-like proline 4-hydroxylase